MRTSEQPTGSRQPDKSQARNEATISNKTKHRTTKNEATKPTIEPTKRP